MHRIGITLLMAGGLWLAPGGIEQAAAQGGYGCLSNGTCKEDPSPINTPDDFWHNWICTECHAGPTSGLAASPVEKSLAASPPKFWAMHGEASRDARTLSRAARYKNLKPSAALPAEFRKLLEQRPGAKR
jgi:hypothetical protein